MTIKISKGLKWTFFIHFIITLFFAVVFTMLVDVYLDFIGWVYLDFATLQLVGDDPITFQLLGFAFYAFALSSFIAWKGTEWEKVRTIVLMEIAWFMGGVYVMFWQLYWHLPTPFPLPPMGWVYLMMFSAFLVAFIVFYIQHEKKRKESN